MVDGQLAAAVQFGAQLAADLHHVLQHLVVVLPGEEDLARVQLVERASDRPHVDRIVERDTQDDLGRAVKSTHEVRHGLRRGRGGIGAVNGGTQIADLEHVAGIVHLEQSAIAPSLNHAES